MAACEGEDKVEETKQDRAHLGSSNRGKASLLLGQELEGRRRCRRAGDECEYHGGFLLLPGAAQSREGYSYCEESGAKEGESGKETP